MKKKLLSIILILVLLLLTACSSAPITEANKLGAISYPGLEWLASPEEMMKTLGKDAGAFEIDDTKYSDSNSYYPEYSTDLTVLGKEATVLLGFAESKKDGDLELDIVQIAFKEATKENYETLKTALTKEIERQQVSVAYSEVLRQVFPGEDDTVNIEAVPIDTEPLSNGATAYYLTYSAESTTYTNELSEEIQKAATEFALESGEIREGTEQTYGEINQLSLSSVSLIYVEKADGTTNLYLFFSANGYNLIMSRAKN